MILVCRQWRVASSGHDLVVWAFRLMFAPRPSRGRSPRGRLGRTSGYEQLNLQPGFQADGAEDDDEAYAAHPHGPRFLTAPRQRGTHNTGVGTWTQRCFSCSFLVFMVLGIVYLVLSVTQPIARLPNSRALTLNSGLIVPPARQQPASVSEQPLEVAETFNCQDEYFDWHSAWSPRKKDWCCKRYRRGCAVDATVTNTTSTTASTTRTPPRAHSHACLLAGGLWRGWPARRRAWCCSVAGVGCPVRQSKATRTSKTTTPPTPTHGYDCDKSDMSSSAREWCCLHRQRGCVASDEDPSTPPIPWPTDNESVAVGHAAKREAVPSGLPSTRSPSGPSRKAIRWATSTTLKGTRADPCETPCSFKAFDGAAATCSSLVRWTARIDFAGKADNCSLAYASVIAECPGCLVCPFTTARCASWVSSTESGRGTT